MIRLILHSESRLPSDDGAGRWHKIKMELFYFHWLGSNQKINNEEVCADNNEETRHLVYVVATASDIEMRD